MNLSAVSLSVLLVPCLLVNALAQEVFEASGTEHVATIAGKWHVHSASKHLLDPEVASAQATGLSITIDEVLGQSHGIRFADYARFLKKQGHEPLATGNIRVDWGGEDAHVVTSKHGSLYLWYGVVFVGNPRIFVGRGSDAATADVLVIEWNNSCSHPPTDPDREWATIVYGRTAETRP